MGNDLVTEIKRDAVYKNMQDKEFVDSINIELKPEGSYHKYKLAQVQAECICNHPFIYFSETLQKDCAQARANILIEKHNASIKTKGFSDYLERL